MGACISEAKQGKVVLREEPMCSGSGVQRGRSVRPFFLVKKDVIIFPVVSLLVTLKLVAAPGFGPGSVLSPASASQKADAVTLVQLHHKKRRGTLGVHACLGQQVSVKSWPPRRHCVVKNTDLLKYIFLPSRNKIRSKRETRKGMYTQVNRKRSEGSE